MERDLAIKITCLPPARVAIPGGHKITAVACGLHHTLLITDRGEFSVHNDTPAPGKMSIIGVNSDVAQT